MCLTSAKYKSLCYPAGAFCLAQICAKQLLSPRRSRPHLRFELSAERAQGTGERVTAAAAHLEIILGLDDGSRHVSLVGGLPSIDGTAKLAEDI